MRQSKTTTKPVPITIDQLNTASVLKISYHTAIINFNHFLRSRDHKALGIKNGWLSQFRHASFWGPSEPKRTLGGLLDIADNKNYTAFNYCVKQIKKYGSLFDGELSNNHSFTNFFLHQLRNDSIQIYRRVVGTVYEIHFLEGTVTLYRRDNRTPTVIFKDGFQLKDIRGNSAETRKLQYSEDFTGTSGISTSEIIPPKEFGKYLYTIELPEGHNLLLVDIVRSPKNTNLTPYRINLAETNCMDNIPAAYISECSLNRRSGDINYTLICENNSHEPYPQMRSAVAHGVY